MREARFLISHMDDEMKLFRLCQRRPVFFSEEEIELEPSDPMAMFSLNLH